MKSVFRVGIVGCGMISDIYLQNIQSVFSDSLEAYGVFDRHLDRSASRAKAYHIPHCYPTLEEMLADPEIDVILNLCPPSAHYAINLQALKAGKHVYSEKPLAETYEQGRCLVTLAREKGLHIGCSPDVPLGALIQTARQLVEEGRIGRIVGASANLIKQGVETWHRNPNFLYQPGGGPLLDMGPYYLTALLHIVGPIACVCAMDAISFPTRVITSQPHSGEVIHVNVPTYVNALLRFECGAPANFTATFDVWESKLPHIEIYGAEGSMLISDPNLFGGKIEIAKPREPYTEVPLQFPYDSNHRGLGLYDLAHAIEAGTTARSDGIYALHILETMDAISRSAREGMQIRLDTSCGKPAMMPRSW